MREIVHIQIGQYGNQVSAKYWEDIAHEHGISSAGKYESDLDIQRKSINTYFREVKTDHYLPRVVLTDLEAETIDQLLAAPFGKLYRSCNVVCGKSATGSNWAKGYYGMGGEHVDSILDAVRKETEDCESIDGFQLAHALGGGTGGGLGSLLIDKLSEEYSDLIIETFSTFPSLKAGNAIPNIYNATLAAHHLIDNAHIVHTFDYDALHNTTHHDPNLLASVAMSTATCSIRFPNLLNNTLRKLATNLVPYPRLHFSVLGVSPVVPSECNPPPAFDYTQEMFDAKNMLCDIDPRSGKYLAATAVYRCRLSLGQLQDQIAAFQSANASCFTEWIPDSFKATVCDVPYRGFVPCAASVANSTAVQEVLRRIAEQFTSAFKRKSLLHPYLLEGMTEEDFLEAEGNVYDLVLEYQQGQEVAAEDTDEAEDWADFGVDPGAATEPE